MVVDKNQGTILLFNYDEDSACARVPIGPPLISSGKESIWLINYYVAKEGRIVTLIIKEVIVVDKREDTEI